MEKKYCTHCNTIADLNDCCEGCGRNEFRRIIISVQSLKRFKKGMSK